MNLWNEIQEWWRDSVGIQQQPPYDFNGLSAPPGADGSHFCGTLLDFQNGGTYDPSTPLVKYAKNGLPVCCNIVVVPVGGGGAGGQSSVANIPPLHIYGGAAAGGKSPLINAVQVSPMGGVEIGGQITSSYSALVEPAGGVEIGRTVTHTIHQQERPAGGVEIGGTVGLHITTPITVAGGVEIGGAVVTTVNTQVNVGGGVTGGGGVTVSPVQVVTPTGGVSDGGTVTVGSGPTGVSFTSNANFLGSTGMSLPPAVNGKIFRVYLVGPDTPSTPSGWTLTKAQSCGFGSLFQTLFTKVSNGTETHISFPGETTNFYAGVAIITAKTAVDVVGESTGAGTNLTAASQTATGSTDDVDAAFVIDPNQTATATSPLLMVAQVTLPAQSGVDSCTLAVGYRTLSASGSSGASHMTVSTSAFYAWQHALYK